MANIVVMGESMVEFSPLESGVFRQSFAGDVYNTAVYLKRMSGFNTTVSLLTGIGNDRLSEQMLTAFKQEHLDVSLIQVVENKTVGAYLIETCPDGERSFVYWRDSSAAKFTLSCLSENCRANLIATTDTFYFSGISLAIINGDERALFWQLLQQLKDAGCKIVFDSNYRPRLWQSSDDAKTQYQQALKFSDLVFAGGEDFELLNGMTSDAQISQYLSVFDINELIIKNGAQNVICLFDSQRHVVDVTPVNRVVDSTSAGDSFNAGYLSGRAQGLTVIDAVKLGCKVSALVIQHPGAIVDSRVFSDSLNRNFGAVPVN